MNGSMATTDLHTWPRLDDGLSVYVYSSLDSLKETEALLKPSWSKNISLCCDEPDHQSIHRILVQINRGRNDDSLQKQTEICVLLEVKTSNLHLT